MAQQGMEVQEEEAALLCLCSCCVYPVSSKTKKQIHLIKPILSSIVHII